MDDELVPRIIRDARGGRSDMFLRIGIWLIVAYVKCMRMCGGK